MAATLRNLISLMNSAHYRQTHGLPPKRRHPKPPSKKNWALAQKLLKNYCLIPDPSPSEDENHEKGPPE
jgi:hypothetical protein